MNFSSRLRHNNIVRNPKKFPHVGKGVAETEPVQNTPRDHHLRHAQDVENIGSVGEEIFTSK